jgi:hypothetical protein
VFVAVAAALSSATVHVTSGISKAAIIVIVVLVVVVLFCCGGFGYHRHSRRGVVVV